MTKEELFITKYRTERDELWYQKFKIFFCEKKYSNKEECLDRCRECKNRYFDKKKK